MEGSINKTNIEKDKEEEDINYSRSATSTT